MRVLACVISYETAGHLPAVLATLAEQDGVDLDVVVVDNASADGSAAAAREAGARTVANPDNRGYAGAANQGLALAAAAGAEALLLLNPDVRLARGHVAALAQVLEEHPRAASVQGKLWRFGPGRVLDTTGHRAFVTRLFRNRGEGEVDSGQHDRPGEVFGVSGACALYRRASLEDIAVGGEAFDPDLFAFFEDVDVDWRLRLRGWEAHYEPAATARHERGGAGVRRSAVVEELNWANRLLVVLKNDDPAALARRLPAVAGTTLLKTAELGFTVPPALLRGGRRLARLLPAARARRRAIMAAATVDPAEVVARWFEAFDYGRWVTTWARRMRPGHH